MFITGPQDFLKRTLTPTSPDGVEHGGITINFDQQVVEYLLQLASWTCPASLFMILLPLAPSSPKEISHVGF